MNLSAVSTTEIVLGIVFLAVVLIAGVGIWRVACKRRTERLRTKFGGPEYTRAVEEGGSRRQAEAALDKRAERVEGLHIRPLAAADRMRFVESWGRVQARFVDGPGSAVTDADRLLGDVMSTRGYPVSDFEQRAADICRSKIRKPAHPSRTCSRDLSEIRDGSGAPLLLRQQAQ
jgi:hypothetical protein